MCCCSGPGPYRPSSPSTSCRYMFVCLSDCMYAYLCMCLSVLVSVCLSVHASVDLSVCRSVHITSYASISTGMTESVGNLDMNFQEMRNHLCLVKAAALV